jgi:hypothetical protein
MLAFFILLLNQIFKLVDLVNMSITTNYVFKVLKQANIIFFFAFRVHEWNLFDFALQDQKPIVIEVNSFFPE